MLREGLIAGGVSADRIDVIPSEAEAVDAALRMARSGDLVLIFGDQLTRCWKQIVHFRPEAKSAPGVEARAAETPAPVSSSADVVRVALASKHDDDSTRDDFMLVRDERGVHLARDTDD